VENTSKIEAMLVKQGKQIRALYEVQKETLEKLDSIQNQVKKLASSKSAELDQKIYNVSN
jgi:tRNA(Ser,Leu) C12 N-acetylase TAN1